LEYFIAKAKLAELLKKLSDEILVLQHTNHNETHIS